MHTGLVRPLRLSDREWAAASAAEASALRDLKSPQGTRSVMQFVEQALICDRAQSARRNSLSRRIGEWSDFQARKIRIPGNHADRIATSDGIEDDDYGHWARAAALALEGSLEQVAAATEQKYVMANLARGLKYKVRAEAAGTCYQAHPMRRDFSLTFQLNQDDADNESVLDLIKAVRGIHRSLSEAAGTPLSHRMRLLELELPLLGGRLWDSSETLRESDQTWLEMVVDRIRDYRDSAAELRETVMRCVTDEDLLRVVRDIDEVKEHLLDRLGLRRVETSAVERELVDDVASVVQMATGVPRCRDSGSARGPSASRSPSSVSAASPTSSSSIESSCGRGRPPDADPPLSLRRRRTRSSARADAMIASCGRSTSSQASSESASVS